MQPPLGTFWRIFTHACSPCTPRSSSPSPFPPSPPSSSSAWPRQSQTWRSCLLSFSHDGEFLIVNSQQRLLYNFTSVYITVLIYLDFTVSVHVNPLRTRSRLRLCYTTWRRRRQNIGPSAVTRVELSSWVFWSPTDRERGGSVSLVAGHETLTANWSPISCVQPFLCDFYAHKLFLQIMSHSQSSPQNCIRFSRKSRAFNVEIVAYQVPRLPIQTHPRIYVFPT